MEEVIQTMCCPAPFSSGKAPGFLSRLLQEGGKKEGGKKKRLFPKEGNFGVILKQFLG